MKSGDVCNETSLAAWLTDIITAWHRPQRHDPAAPCPPRRRRTRRAERNRGSRLRVGRQLANGKANRLTRARRSCLPPPHGAFRTLPSASRIRSRSGPLPARIGFPKTPPRPRYLQAFTTNLISAAVRLVPLGQTAGLRVLAALEPDHPSHCRRNDRRLRSTTSAVARSAPTLPPCGTKPSTQGCSAHDHIAPWPPSRGCRRSRRHRQDRADGRACARHFRDDYEIAAITNDIYTKEDAEFLTRAGSLPVGAYPRHRNRRLPAHRDPRGRFDQPRRRRRSAAGGSPTST